MKKIQNILMSLAGVVMVTACMMDPLEEASSVQKGKGQTVTFTATAAQSDAETKTTLLDGGPEIYWAPGDEITVLYKGLGSVFQYGGEEPTLQARFEGTLNGFTGSIESGAEPETESFTALYPREGVWRWYSDGTVKADIPVSQKAIAGTFDPRALVTMARSNDLSLAFYNVCGGVKFCLTQEGVTEVVFSSNDDTPLAGLVTVVMDEEGHPVVSGEVENPKTSIELAAPSGETFVVGEWYYLVCLPASLEKGFTMTLYSGDKIMAFRQDNPITVKRSVWGRLAITDEDITYLDEESLQYTEIFYTTTDGNPISFTNSQYFNEEGTNYVVSNTCNNGLGRILFHSPITQIPQYAFSYTNTLKTIWLPNSVKVIEAAAFTYDPSLESVRVPASVEAVGQQTFYKCPSLASLGDKLTSEDGRCLIIDGNLVGFAPAGVTPDYTLPRGITAIGNRVFYGISELHSLVIPEGVENIWDAAFRASGLQTVTLPNSLKAIRANAFSSTPLTTVTIPEGVTVVGDSAFAYCWQMTTASLLGEAVSLGDGVFSGGDALMRFEGPLASDDGLMLVQDGTIKAIAPAGLEESGTLTIPNTIRVIGNSFLSNLSTVKKVILEAGGTWTLESRAFYNCNNLEEVVINGTISSYGSELFYYSNNLRSFGGNSSYTSSDGRCVVIDGNLVGFAPAGADGAYSIDDNVTSITDYVFSNCKLTSISIPGSVQRIGDFAFYNAQNLTSISLQSGLRSIGEQAFNRCSSLQSITIPDTVTDLGSMLFWNCAALRTVTLPADIEEIRPYLFRGCTGLTSYTVPASVKRIGEYAFDQCTALTEVNLSVGLESIGEQAFGQCTSLAGITIPASVTAIPPYAFSGCTSLTGVTLNNGLQEIDTQAFYNCSSLTSVSIPASVIRIGKNAFGEAAKLASVTLNDGLQEIGQTAFTGTSLTVVDIPASVVSLGLYCLGNQSLTKVILRPTTVPTLQLNLSPFSNWANLKNIEVAVPSELLDYYRSTYPWSQYTITEI